MSDTPEIQTVSNGVAFECLLRYFWNAETDTETWMLVSHDKRMRMTFDPADLKGAISLMIEHSPPSPP